MSSDSRSFHRPKEHIRHRISKTAEAHDSLAEFGKGVELDVATFGQFSFADAVGAVLDKTGPAAVTLATWTAAEFDLRRLWQFNNESMMTDFRFIIDRSYPRRQPLNAAKVLEWFGVDAVRSTRTHAKFCIVQNGGWDVALRTSMNLSYNPRLEYLQVSDNPELAQFWLTIADDIFAEEEPGLGEYRTVPQLRSLDGIAPSAQVRVGSEPAMGRRPRVGVRNEAA